MKKPRQYSDDFKLNAARLVREQGLSCAAVARQLGVVEQNIHRWVQKYDQQVEQESNAARPRSEIEAELRKLRHENAQLRMEKEILKKATAFFAKESR